LAIDRLEMKKPAVASIAGFFQCIKGHGRSPKLAALGTQIGPLDRFAPLRGSCIT